MEAPGRGVVSPYADERPAIAPPPQGNGIRGRPEGRREHGTVAGSNLPWSVEEPAIDLLARCAFPTHFGDLPDSRIDRCKRRDLLEVVTVKLCAVIRGSDT